FLFAVNQGSDTIAVFRVDTATGALTPVPGSPFPSGGRAPISASFNGRFLVVANHGLLTGDRPPGDPAHTSYTSFSMSPGGQLHQVATLPQPAAAPIDTALSPDGRLVFTTGFFSLKLQALRVAPNGGLSPAPGSPQSF